MDEYISRETVVKRIKSSIFTADDAWESGYNAAMAEIMYWIKHIPSADVQPVKHGQWISVEDDLPENEGLYIVCKTFKGHQISFEARWKGNKWLSVGENKQLDYVTHWQPMPYPPNDF